MSTVIQKQPKNRKKPQKTQKTKTWNIHILNVKKFLNIWLIRHEMYTYSVSKRYLFDF